MRRRIGQYFLEAGYRLKDKEDENPAITDYLGRGDAQVVHFVEKNIFYLRGVPSLRTGDNNHGNYNSIGPFRL